MTEAQLYARFLQTDAAVGIVDELSQQMTLDVGLMTAVELACTELDIPPGIIILPEAIQVLCRKDVRQVTTLVKMSVELEKSHLNEEIVQLPLINHLLD